MSRVALGAFARLVPRLHPWLRAWDAYLLLREMAEQMQGVGTVVRPRPWQVVVNAPPGEDRAWTIPPGWQVTWCPGFATAATMGGTPYVFLPGPNDCGVYVGQTSQGGNLTDSDAAIYATLGAGAGSNNTIWGPLTEFTPFDKRRQFRGSISEPAGWSPGQPRPTPVDGVEAGLEWWPWSPSGLGAPSALSAPRDALGRIQLPGQVPGPRNLRWGQVRLIQAVRAELGLSERLVPGRIEWLDPQPEAVPVPLAAPWPAQRWPGFEAFFPPRWLSQELRPGRTGVRFVQGPRFRWRIVPGKKGRERKLKFRTRTGRWIGSNQAAPGGSVALSKGLAVAQSAFSGVTEAMDLVENIWDALPRSSRTAGTTATGNRRLDQMLKDLRRDWDRVDWREAMANVQWNAVEDMAYGGMAMLATAGAGATGFGAGLVGGGAILPGYQGLYQSRGAEPVSYADHPIGRLLDWMRGKQETGVGFTERDPSDRISRGQAAGLLARVPQRDAQGWFDTRFEDGFPWVVTRPGQRVNPAPPSPKAPHLVDQVDAKIAAYTSRRARKVAEFDAWQGAMSNKKRKGAAIEARLNRRKAAYVARSVSKKGKANGLLSKAAPVRRSFRLSLLR